VSTDQNLDFSDSAIPDSWQDAANQAPGGGPVGARRRRPTRPVPTRSSVDLFSAAMAGTVTSGLLGLGWYTLESTGTVMNPLLALAVGTALAVMVRLGGGPDDPGTRGIVALLFYLATSCTVIILVAREVFAAAYGSNPGLAEFEQSLRNSRFAEPVWVVCWVAGAVSAVHLSRVLRRRG
jgi:hypothetical protein